VVQNSRGCFAALNMTKIFCHPERSEGSIR
jgi:hypothetical protein